MSTIIGAGLIGCALGNMFQIAVAGYWRKPPYMSLKDWFNRDDNQAGGG